MGLRVFYSFFFLKKYILHYDCVVEAHAALVSAVWWEKPSPTATPAGRKSPTAAAAVEPASAEPPATAAASAAADVVSLGREA